MIIYNLASDETRIYGDGTSRLYAVCNAWAEDNNMMSAWTYLIHSSANVEQFKEAGFPVSVGKLSIGCGDWAAMENK